ncbi:histidine phosphatase family protein [Nocardioides convexus]|uniref:histidine phosphatase family protein n=1 Tax=Nocardioides convexus TaxID=2712224 RepID=UPI0024189EE3|nr:histidine phosphatase family protein [Nocardioides convexus]
MLVRHGVTPHTTGRRFSGGLGGDNPALSEEGLAQAAEVARWLSEPEGEHRRRRHLPGASYLRDGGGDRLRVWACR